MPFNFTTYLLVANLKNGTRIIGGATDGEKFICLDNLIHDIKKEECLVYSFGIANDWTFEESMASLGCTVSGLIFVFSV